MVSQSHLMLWATGKNCLKNCKEQEEQHTKALEACLKCGSPFGSSSVGSSKDSAMIQTTQHLEPTGEREEHDFQQPAAVF